MLYILKITRFLRITWSLSRLNKSIERDSRTVHTIPSAEPACYTPPNVLKKETKISDDQPLARLKLH